MNPVLAQWTIEVLKIWSETSILVVGFAPLAGLGFLVYKLIFRYRPRP